VSAGPHENRVRRGRGRPAGGSDARERILTAARAEFAARGYDAVSLRAIARAAGVDPALLHHYFDGKEQVFAAAMRLDIDPREIVTTVLTGPRDELGERLVRFFLSVWSDRDRRGPFLGLLAAATSSDAAAAMLREFFASALLTRIADALGRPDARLRTSLVASQLVGLGIVRYVVAVEPLASASDDDVVALVGPVVQAYLTGGS
jgi:AcrR family transcriptional regulator